MHTCIFSLYCSAYSPDIHFHLIFRDTSFRSTSEPVVLLSDFMRYLKCYISIQVIHTYKIIPTYLGANAMNENNATANKTANLPSHNVSISYLLTPTSLIVRCRCVSNCVWYTPHCTTYVQYVLIIMAC